MASKQSRDRLAFHRLREVSPVAHALQHHPQLLGSVRFRAQALGLKGSGLKGSGLESKVNCGVLMFPLLACFLFLWADLSLGAGMSSPGKARSTLNPKP